MNQSEAVTVENISLSPNQNPRLLPAVYMSEKFPYVLVWLDLPDHTLGECSEKKDTWSLTNWSIFINLKIQVIKHLLYLSLSLLILHYRLM